jgi:hypothetical protein
LNLLRYDYVDLSQLIPKPDGFSEVKVSRPKPKSVPPLDVSVFTLRGRLAWVCQKSEDHLRAFVGAQRRVVLPVREGFSLDSSIRYLQPRVDDLALLPAEFGPIGEDWEQCSGVDLLLMVGELHRQARRVCGLDPRTISVPGDCPGCAVPSLRRHDDDPERIWCQRCHLQLSKVGYYSATRMQYAPSPQSP